MNPSERIPCSRALQIEMTHQGLAKISRDRHEPTKDRIEACPDVVECACQLLEVYAPGLQADFLQVFKGRVLCDSSETADKSKVGFYAKAARSIPDQMQSAP